MSKLSRVIAAAEQGQMMTLRSNAIFPLADEAGGRASPVPPSEAVSRRRTTLMVSSRPNATYIISPQGDDVPLHKAIKERPDIFIGEGSEDEVLSFELGLLYAGFWDIGTWRDKLCSIQNSTCRDIWGRHVEGICDVESKPNHEMAFVAIERSLAELKRAAGREGTCKDQLQDAVRVAEEILRRGGHAVRVQFPTSDDNELAPTDDNELAPADDNELAPADDNELAPTVLAVCDAVAGAGYYHGFKGPLDRPMMGPNNNGLTIGDAIRIGDKPLRHWLYFFTLRAGDVRRVMPGQPFGFSADITAFVVSPFPRDDVFLYDWLRPHRGFANLMKRKVAKRHWDDIMSGGVLRLSDLDKYQVHKVRRGHERTPSSVEEVTDTHVVRRMKFDDRPNIDFQFALGRNPVYAACVGGWSTVSSGEGHSERLQGGEVKFIPWNNNTSVRFSSVGQSPSTIVAVSPR